MKRNPSAAVGAGLLALGAMLGSVAASAQTDPAVVTSCEETIAAIEEPVQRARAFCAENADRGVDPAGRPVKHSHDLEP